MRKILITATVLLSTPALSDEMLTPDEAVAHVATFTAIAKACPDVVIPKEIQFLAVYGALSYLTDAAGIDTDTVIASIEKARAAVIADLTEHPEKCTGLFGADAVGASYE